MGVGGALVVLLAVPVRVSELGDSTTCGHLGAVAALGVRSDPATKTACKQAAVPRIEIAVGIAVVGLIVGRALGSVGAPDGGGLPLSPLAAPAPAEPPKRRREKGPWQETVTLRVWVANARALHDKDRKSGECPTCHVPWPCPTANALGGE